jgi:hypothetical protein
MKQAITIQRRTFEASKFPKDSEERAALNRNAVTSEYMTSYRYAVVVPPTDDYPHTFIYTTRTKTEAEEKMRELLAREAS